VLALAFNFQLRSANDAPRLARDALTPLAGEVGQELLTQLRLVVSELVTNSVQFGPGEPISIDVEVQDDGVIRGAVNDGGVGGVELVDPDPVAASGLGLRIVDTLASDWGVEPGTTRVWFELAHDA
jgi:anti-sigma regulatory factor (Ser/Thr protein kinase)